MSGWTPGPWSRRWVYGAIRHINKNVDEGAFYDAELDPDRETTNTPNVRINEGDADLIAAAPDLVEALEALLAEAGWRGHGPNGDLFYCEHCGRSALDYSKTEHEPDCAVVRARAALEKAGCKP